MKTPHEMAQELMKMPSPQTPPAPEVEPVAWRRVERDICDEYVTVYRDEVAPEGRDWEPLYTHPANDGLRKAAEEALELLDRMYGYGNEERATVENLRAELDKGKS